MNNQIEKVFIEIEKQIRKTIAKNTYVSGEVYVAGFWLFYCDCQTIGQPCFGYNIIGNENDFKWSPSEWVVDVEENMVDALSQSYNKLSELMQGSSEEDWEQLMLYQYDFYTTLCKDLNAEVSSDLSPFKTWNTSKDFIVGVFEEQESEEFYTDLINASVGEDVAIKLDVV
ncbi:hypothetical protein [Photobacterium marinum]|nr:hypothetical protein [Photobacterium marinum]